MTILHIKRGDITQYTGDAIVNAANTGLVGGGGVDGAIHRAAGPKLNEACLKLGGCPTGEAKATPGFNLPAKFIIHTPGPIWRDGSFEEPKLLRNSYLNSLKLAQQLGCQTIAFPSISTGVYHYPLDDACQIAIKTITQFDGDLDVTMICFDEATYQAFERNFKVE